MQTEQVAYKLGKIFLIISIVGVVLLWITDYRIISWFPPCAFFTRTGLYCPGCGGTRALKSLLRGDIIRAFLYHPFVVYFAFAYMFFMVYEFCKKHFKTFRKIFPVEIVIDVGVGFLLLQWIVKVILQFVL